MGRQIRLIESFSAGKKQGQNDDSIYVGEYFAAVVDGVSNKSSMVINGKKIKVADIIVEAIKRLDTSVYAEQLTFEVMIPWINKYLNRYLKRNGIEDNTGKMEATAAIYSKYYNQIWIIGDCRAIYDDNEVLNLLRIDDIYIALRKKIINGLLEDGYTKEQLLERDISKEIIHNPKLLDKKIFDSNIKRRIITYRNDLIRKTLIGCGYTNEEIDENNLVQKYYNPRDIQKVAKNNPNMGIYGYSILNGDYTEPANCRIEQLPENVKRIILSSDGLPFDALRKGGIQEAVIRRASLAENDRLSIEDNSATHSAKRYLPKGKERSNEELPYAIDDGSAVEIEIIQEKNIQEELEI